MDQKSKLLACYFKVSGFASIKTHFLCDHLWLIIKTHRRFQTCFWNQYWNNKSNANNNNNIYLIMKWVSKLTYECLRMCDDFCALVLYCKRQAPYTIFNRPHPPPPKYKVCRCSVSRLLINNMIWKDFNEPIILNTIFINKKKRETQEYWIHNF